MRQQRWFPIAALAVGLFAINLVTRLVVRFGFDGGDSAENRATIVMFVLTGVVLATYTFIVAQRKRPTQWLPDVGGGVIVAMLLIVLVGPFVSGTSPFAGGAGDFFSQIWLYSGFAIVGTLLGFWTAMMLGRDYRSRSLKAYTELRSSKPRRVVRR
jgi:hypothetical protein